MKGEGNQQDYGMRVYDPRLGKFLNVDPLTKDYPWYTPYQFAGNSPIKAIDLDGLEPVSVGVAGNEIVYDGGFIVNSADIYRITFLNVVLGLQLPRNLPSNPYDDQDPYNRSEWQKAYENVQFFFTHHTPAFSRSEAATKTVQMLMVKQLFSGKEEDAEDAIRQIDKSDDFFYRYAVAESVAIFDSFVFAANNYIKGLFKVVSSKYYWVQKAINALETANPRSVRSVESIITDPRNGIIKTDFDIILDRHIVEVTGGNGGKKLTQIQDKIKLHTNKEVVLYAPKIGKHAKEGLEKAGIQVFTNTDDLVKYINK